MPLELLRAVVVHRAERGEIVQVWSILTTKTSGSSRFYALAEVGEFGEHPPLSPVRSRLPFEMSSDCNFGAIVGRGRLGFGQNRMQRPNS
jgi:hypothetical protein